MTMILLSVVASLVAGLLRDEINAWGGKLSQIIVAIAVRRAPDSLKERLCEEWSAHVADVPGQVSKIIVACGFVWAAIRLPIDTALPRMSFGYRGFTRAADLTLGGIGFFLIAPLLAILATIMWASTGGAPIVAQTRFGRRGQPFKLYRFRTNKTGRHRPTRIGRVVYMTAMSELPRLFNVLRGDLSLVGDPAMTRPPAAGHVLVSDLKPGLTPRFDKRLTITGYTRSLLTTWWLAIKVLDWRAP